MRYRNNSIFLPIYGSFLMLACIVLLWTFGSSIQVYASEMDDAAAGSDTSSTMEYTVTGIENSEQLTNLAPFELIRHSTQNTEPLFYHIYNNGLLNVTANIEDSNGNTTTQRLSVSWSCWDDSTTVTNTTVCGEYIETGIIELPDDSYKWGEGVLSVLTLPVKVYDPAPAERVEIVKLEEVWNDFDIAFSLVQNGSIEDILRNENNTISLQTKWPCYDAAENEYLCPIVYNTEDVREDTVGVYYITVTFEAPLNCRFSDSLTVPSYSIPVTVQAPGQPRLDLCYIGPFGFIFPWITSGIDLETMEVWMSENNDEWRKLEPGWDISIYDSMLLIYNDILPKGSSYRIQVDYEGGQTGIASFTYTDEGLSNTGYIEGDRDGGDTEGNPPTDSGTDENTGNTPPTDSGNNENTNIIPPNDFPDNENTNNTPPADSPDNGNNSGTNNTVSTPEKKDTVTEEDNTLEEDSSTENDSSEIKTEDTSTPADDSKTEKETKEPIAEREEPYLLGREINLMLGTLGTARFSAEAIMLDIPEKAIASLDISDTDRLLVAIVPLENNGFSIDILKNDIAITTVSSMQISLPYQPAENTIPVLMNKDGEKVASGDYKPDTRLVTFTINETGTFYIRNEEVSMQDTFASNTLTVTEISAPTKDNDNSVFKLIAIAAPVIICSAAVTIFVYTKKRRT